MRIISRAPTRIDLAGGTLDLWPLYLLQEEAVTINVAIDLYATARLDPLPGSDIELISVDQGSSQTAGSLSALTRDGSLPLLSRLVHHFHPQGGFRLETDCRAPAGSGLGGSSALAIAVCGALNHFTSANYTAEDIVAASRDVEAQVIRIPTGEQDYYAAVYGGTNAWHFRARSVERELLRVSPEEIERRFLLFYSGVPRASGINNWQVFKNRIDGDPATISRLADIGKSAEHLLRALRAADWTEAFAAIAEEWTARIRLAPTMTTPEIDAILDFGRAHGAKAAKVCGAGGGGCLFLAVEPRQYESIKRAARDQKLPLLDFRAAETGLDVQVIP